MLSCQSLILLAASIGLCCCQEEFRCKPRPGCEIAQCDPFYASWTNLGSDFIGQLEKEEFPITCVGAKKDSVGANQEELNDLKQEMSDVRQMIKFQGRKISRLESENKDLKKDIAEMESTISTLNTSVQSLTSKNTSEKEDTQTLKKPKPKSKCEDGDIYYGGHCFWVDDTKRDFADSELECASRDADVGHIMDSKHYRFMMKKLRETTAPNYSFWFWLGLQQDPLTGNVTVISSGLEAPYLKWESGDPQRGSTDTNIVLRVIRDASSYQNGMGDSSPLWAGVGVICQYKSL